MQDQGISEWPSNATVSYLCCLAIFIFVAMRSRREENHASFSGVIRSQALAEL